MPMKKSRQVIFFTKEEMEMINSVSEKHNLKVKDTVKRLIWSGYDALK